MKYDEEFDRPLSDSTRVATLHVNAPAGDPADEAKVDESSEQFVALYYQNTSVRDQCYLCLSESLLSE